MRGKLSCKGGHDWVIREWVINFGSVEEGLANNLTESYEQYNEEKMDKKFSESVPQNPIIIIGGKAKKFIIDSINNKKVNLY